MSLDYYLTASAASKQIGMHPGLHYIKQQAKTAQKILDVGCGEGSRLATLLPKNKAGQGLDINPKAISLAKKQYPGHKFIVGDAGSLPFNDNSFDLVYSAFALEHVTDPKAVLKEMVRVCTPGGQMVIICPNFGAPNRRSPNSLDNPVVKLIKNFLQDWNLSDNSLNWQQVIPQTEYTAIDSDTTIEPYLLSLKKYLTYRLRLQPLKYSSCWELEEPSTNPRKRLFKWLGVQGIYPFNYWGPQIFIAVIKKNHVSS